MKFKKLISIILVAVMLTGVFNGVACSNNNGGQIFVPIENSALYRYDVVDMDLLMGVEADGVIWKSANDKIISVKDGVVEAVKEGKTTVTAVFNGKAQSQTISVVASPVAPEIRLNDIPLIVGAEFNVNPKLTHKGRVLNNATFSVISADSSVASVESSSVKALKLGNTTLNVSAFIDGELVASKEVAVNVKSDNGIVPAISNYELYITPSVKGVSFDTELNLDAEVYVDGQKVDSPTVSWEVGNSSVAAIADGKIKAVSIGETSLIGTYTDGTTELKTLELPVTVDMPILEEAMLPDVIIDLDKTVQEFDTDAIMGEGKNIGKIYLTAKNKNYEVADNKVTTSRFNSGEYSCILYDDSNSFGVKANLHVADYVVYDYNTLLEVSNPDNVSGYVVMANDVDCGSTGYKNNYINASNTVFTGVFNGLGHTISNFGTPTGGSGLYEDVASATFKNTAVVGLTLTAWNVAAFFYRNTKGGETVVDNCYVEQYNSSVNNIHAAGIFVFNFKGSVKITNTIVKSTGVENTNVGAFVGRANEMIGISNSYAIGQLLPCSSVSNANNKMFEDINKQLNVKYDSESAFIKARNKEGSKINLSGFNAYWNTELDVPCFKTVEALTD